MDIAWRCVALVALLVAELPIVALGQPTSSRNFIRVNQLGYLPDAPKTAIICSLDSVDIKSFTVQDVAGHVVLGPRTAESHRQLRPV